MLVIKIRMEVLYIAGALGAVHSLFTQGESDSISPAEPPVLATPLPSQLPRPAMPTEPTSISAGSGVRPIPMMPDRSRDSSLFLDDRSLQARTGHSFDPDVYTGKAGRDHPSPMFGMDVGAVRNVHVRNDTGYRGRETQAFTASQYMTGVNPTTQIQVGPGVNIDASKAAGNHGFHWGATRMMPTDVHTHHQLKGGIIPGKAIVNQRESTPLMRKQRPDRFFEVSESYTTSAPGRSVGTAATARVEPEVRHTNRATELTREYPSGGVVGVAPGAYARESGDRTASENAVFQSQRGMSGERGLLTAPSMPTGPGHQLTQQNMSLPAGQRTTTQFASPELLPVNNPGQPAFNPGSGEARSTLRSMDRGTDVINLQAQAPEGPNRVTDYVAPTTERQLGNWGDFGPARSTFDNTGTTNEKTALEQGRLGTSTLREMTHVPYQGGASSYLTNPATYEDILKAEGYSNRSVEESDRMAGGERANVLNDKNQWTRTELPAPMPNAARGGNLERAAASNLHVVNTQLEANPNRVLPTQDRADPSVLQENHLVPSLPVR
jgi:hypothetical protein